MIQAPKMRERYSDFTDFQGFRSVAYYRENTHQIPQAAGVYVLLRDTEKKPDFQVIGSGGRFKERNPNISLRELDENWVPGAKVVYIGKAGGTGSSATLRGRLDQLLKFGAGRKIGHWGGRLLWQLTDHEELLLGWMPISDQEPAALEAQMIAEFKNHFGQRPFANLMG